MPPTLPQNAIDRRFATIGPHDDPAWRRSHPPHGCCCSAAEATGSRDQLLAGNIASRHTVWRNGTDREVPE
jgi:hypothetical protein